MTGAGLVYFPVLILSIYIASRSYRTQRTKLLVLLTHVLASAAVVAGLIQAVIADEPGVIGLWLVIFGPGAAIALCRLLAMLWHQIADTNDEQPWGTPPRNDGSSSR